MQRVLLVEDEVLVAMYVEDVLSDLGYKVIALATNLDEAIEQAGTKTFDLAVLDVNLAGQMSFPVAAMLREREIPFLFLSGYTSGAIIDEFRNEVRLRKPLRMPELARAIKSIQPS
jgi:DNA-binding response OmpR family regulator